MVARGARLWQARADLPVDAAGETGSMDVRMAGADHSPGIQAIYGPIVAATTISFEYDVPSAAEMGRRVASRWPRHPWLVAVAGEPEQVLGYAYAGPFKGRPAYDWSAEVSLYIHPDARRLGVGRCLYAALFALLRAQGHTEAFAGISLPNEASVAAHESLGFVPVGCYRRVGWKFGAWHDVGWWQLPLGPGGSGGSGGTGGRADDGLPPPAPIRPLDTLTPDELASALGGSR